MVRLVKAIIHPYKCFEAEQSFQVEKNLTALMGRNEAGKTSALEAMAKADYIDSQNEEFSYNVVYDYPRRQKRELDKSTETPLAVTFTYQADAFLADEIERDILLSPDSRLFSRCTNYEGRCRVVENGFEYSVRSFLEAYAQKKDESIEKFIKPLSGIQDKREFKRFMNYAKKSITQEEEKALEGIAPYFENKNGWVNPINEYVYRTYLRPNVPKFLYYDEYYLLPSRVSIDRLVENDALTDSERTAKALLQLAEIDMDKVLESQDFESYKTELEVVQAEFTEEFLKYWTNNKNLRIEFELIREKKNGQKESQKKGFFGWGKKKVPETETFLEIRVQDKRNMVSLPLGNRSRGFNWFFSFWVWFKAIQKENVCPFVILMDEPGLNLHAAAQKDLMRLMQDISQQNQIIFTTHSPYMLEEVKNQIYCIVDREGGSTIRPLRDETDEETLLPIRYIRKS